VAGATVIAALYVQKDGAYFGLPDVDPWDEERDARQYAGPWPVVAHPPCQKWCQLAPLNASRLDAYYVGDDGGCFAAALNAVRRFGGVLEHPALSYAWDAYELPRPVPGGWTGSFFDSGYTTEVAQVAYGHEARKRTWLYAVGCELPVLDWREPEARAKVSGFGLTRDKASRWTNQTALNKGKSSCTPPSFRDALLAMARSALPSFAILPALPESATTPFLSHPLQVEPLRDSREAVA
jgi:hypothetical protein